MGNPLQDQLLKAGLVSKKQANKAKQEQYQNQKKKKKDKAVNTAAAARAAEAQRNREINQKRAEEQRRREQQAQIKQLIEQNRLELDGNGSPYHFAVDKKIHRIFAAEEMIDQLSKGRLAVVRFNDIFEVVPAKAARQIAERDKEAVVVLRTA
ncbi:MAG: DUF2058 family protein [Candidatus Electrothrix sp. YB6]